MSYSTLYSYLNDETERSLIFLNLSADVLGVRPAWLIVDQGPPILDGQTLSDAPERRDGDDFDVPKQLRKRLRLDNETTKTFIFEEYTAYTVRALFLDLMVGEEIAGQFERYLDIPWHSQSLIEGACWTILAHILHEQASKKELLGEDDVTTIFRNVGRVVGEMLQLPLSIGEGMVTRRDSGLRTWKITLCSSFKL